MKKIMLLCICVSLLLSCSGDFIGNRIKAKDFETDTLIRITNWYALLPFRPDTFLTVFERQEQDFFLDFGKSEEEIRSMDDFLSIKPEGLLKLKTLKLPLSILDFSNIVKLKPPMACYAATTIASETPLSAVMTVSAYQSCKVWVNGALVYVSDWKRGRSEYREEFIPVNLEKGTNFVMIKVTISDTVYEPAQWKFEADITNRTFAKKLYNSEFSRYFIKKSLVASGDSLKIYAGPNDDLRVIISKDDHELIDKTIPIISSNRSASIDIAGLSNGLYKCKVWVDSTTLEQHFYYGDIHRYYEEKKEAYSKMESKLSEIERSNFDGLFKRLFIGARTETYYADNIYEYWNRMRIPTIQMLNQALLEPTNASAYFIRSFKSLYLDKIHHYSAYVPKTGHKKMPVFIILHNQEMEVDDWTDHWRNHVADGLDQIIDLADKLGFIAVWTDCGGGNNQDRILSVFDEIHDHICSTLPVDTARMFLMGVCESTKVALLILHHRPDKVKGSAFVNPMDFPSPYFDSYHDNHLLCMLYSYHDERISRKTSIAFYNKLRKANLDACLFTNYHSTHYNCRKNYYEPVFEFLMSTVIK